ncbi:MAG: hypothetical protein ALECFALPRED_001819 [Alectoria fallacina]|uniref:Tetratricopeptide repeat domain 27 n=1 Tax=Alectoria fallacina TaxID=1903189 RepID=A0A8H3FBJ1_9LECA|nr:MAG: hypothetical protein ALECFALPRED_001819 [Alectoria fallacina]
MASDLSEILKDVHVRSLLDQDYQKFGLESITLHACDGDWPQFLVRRIQHLLEEQPQAADISHELSSLATVVFSCFLQANVTGPPFSYNPADGILPGSLFEGTNTTIERLQRRLISGLCVDGEAVYHLVPHIELFCLAKCILNHPLMTQNLPLRLARLRVNFWHQRLLIEISSSLQEVIYNDLQLIADSVFTKPAIEVFITPAQFLLERATIHIHHGFDQRAREDIEQAARERSFHFALTGRLGKRTKYQEKELSQLVVLAKSADEDEEAAQFERNPSTDIVVTDSMPSQLTEAIPRKLSLDDDTLLESIAFTQATASAPETQQGDRLHFSLEALDPGNQPLLRPLDAIILLATASSITNTSPTDGLTREETLPYAERVISGGSSNWQVYTQALLVRSRIEGYRSRTIERGVLQLQAVVDQVITETSPFEASKDGAASATATSTAFLPQPKSSESASASERLRYIHQLASPPRWKLESELADRWVSLGGLRTALEIYERLQMWAEVALCWAANEREDKARKIIRRQLYNSVITTSTNKLLEDDEDNDVGDYRIERDPLPADAPRLFCILGDLEKSTAAYERAWEISNQRYARAQRSLGKYYSINGEFDKAGTAYARSLNVNPQNHAIWFALGCIRLQQEDWAGAVDAFGRAVKVEDTDAESWSNLAVALLKLPPDISPGDPNTYDFKPENPHSDGEEILTDGDDGSNPDPQKHVREAFVALKRAAALKRESFRIWQNLLSVSIKLSPPPYTEIIIAQSRLIELLGNVEGERCVDVDLVEALVAHLFTAYPRAPIEVEMMGCHGKQPEDDRTSQKSALKRVGFERMVIDLVQKKITPLITSSRRLWLITAKLLLYLQRPYATLSAYEKAWRVTLNQPGWESGIEEAKNAWKEVVDSTIDLLDGYESLGERTREAGLSAGELVARDWRFKARSAARSVLTRAKEGWEGDEGYEALSERMQELKGA